MSFILLKLVFLFFLFITYYQKGSNHTPSPHTQKTPNGVSYVCGEGGIRRGEPHTVSYSSRVSFILLKLVFLFFLFITYYQKGSNHTPSPHTQKTPNGVSYVCGEGGIRTLGKREPTTP